MPAGLTYETVATTTIVSATSSVTFSSISGSYTDLVLIINAKGTGFSGSGTYPYVRYNSDSGTNYSRTWVTGNGSSASSSRGSSENLQYLVGGTYIDGTFNYNSITHFADYSNTTTHKCIISRANNSSVQTDLLVGLWRSTSAITSIAIYSSSGNFDTGSTFTLYGITAA
jgi:hypothetical protein